MLTPFSNFKTTELSNKEINDYFVAPRNIRLIFSKQVAFVEGQRGSGKTMLMRYIDSNAQRDCNGRLEYLGVYLRFDRFVFGIDSLSEINLFYQQVIISLISTLTERIKTIMKNRLISSFNMYAQEVAKTFYDESTIIAESYDDLLHYIESQRVALTKHLRNPRRIPCPFICDYATCLGRLVRALRQDDTFKNVTVLLLFDEYENLNSKQQSAVNGMIKAAEEGYTYKVFHRPFGIASARVLSGREYLKERDDYLMIDFYQDIIGGDRYFAEFTHEVIRKRLQGYYDAKKIQYSEKDLEIDNYLETKSISEELQDLSSDDYVKRLCKEIEATLSSGIKQSELDGAMKFVEELSDDILRLRLFGVLLKKKQKSQEKSWPMAIIYHFQQQTAQYKNWVHNYKIAVLYLMYHERNRRRCIAGIDQILSVSDGIIRYVLNILHYTFFTFDERAIYPCFPASTQSEAVEKVAEIAFDDMINIPNTGHEISELIQYIGEVFTWYHRDPLLKKWEVNHFTIKDTATLKPREYQEIQDIVKTALTWGMLSAREATKMKSKTDFALQNAAYCLHPIFAVHFNLSWRRKQKCDFSLYELYSILYGNPEVKQKMRKARYAEATGTEEAEELVEAVQVSIWEDGTL